MAEKSIATASQIEDRDFPLKIERDGDIDVQYLEIDPEEERKLVRKLDRVIMPLMAFVYFFQYLDKQSINYASVFGLKKDLGLSGDDFSWAVSLFYFGQLASEFPGAYLMGRLPITLYVGITIVFWGGFEMCLAGTHDFKTLGVVRFLLGVAEGAVSPSFIIITSIWYRKKEHPMRVATWVSMSGVSQIVGAVLMYLIGGAKMNFANWRAMFLICGGLTSTCGVAFLFLMPRSTTTAWFLNEKERELATRRLALDRATRDRKDFNQAQFYEALKQPTTWLYFLMALCITLTTAILKFSSLVINGFGYTQFQTMLVGLPGGAINFGTIWASALVPRFFPGTRIYTSVGLTCVPLLGSVLLMTLPASKPWGIVASTWLASCSAALISCTAGMMASNIKGNTKKSTISAGFFIFYSAGCIISPQAWQDTAAPRYTQGCILSVASWVGLILTFLVYGFVLRRKNASRNRKAEDGDEAYVIKGHSTGVSVDSDLTDVQDKEFRYTL